MEKKTGVESVIRDIKRNTSKRYNAEEKIRIVLEGLKGETTITELCRREGINPNIYYKWSKDFLEAGKKRLNGDIVRSLIQHMEFNVWESDNDFIRKRLRFIILVTRAIREVQSLIKFLPFTKKNDLAMESILTQYLQNLSEGAPGVPIDANLVDGGIRRELDSSLDLGGYIREEPLGRS